MAYASNALLCEDQIMKIHRFAQANNVRLQLNYNDSDCACFHFALPVPLADGIESIHAGMQCLVFPDGFEVSQTQAGENLEMRVYGMYPTLKGALTSLLKGNGSRRKAIWTGLANKK